MWQRLLTLLIVLELIAAVAAIGWRVTRPVPPAADLDRLDADAQRVLKSLHAAAWSGSAASWNRLGNGYLGNGFFGQAETCYRHVLDRDPANITARYGLALSLSRSGRTSEAIEEFRRFINVAGHQHSDPAWYQIGRCYLREEKPADAEAAFGQVRQMTEAGIQLARLLVRLERESEADDILDRLLERYPNSLHVLETARNAERQRNRKREEAEFEARLETAAHMFSMALDVSDVENYRRMAESAVLGTDAPSAHTDATSPSYAYERLTARMRGNPDWHNRRLMLPAAQAALQSGQPHTAIKLLDESFERCQVTPEALVTYGDAQLALERPDEAERAWHASLALRPTAEAHQRLSERSAAAGDETQQQHHAAMASRLAGIARFRNRQWNAALEALTSAVTLNPDDSRTWLYIGKTHLRLDNLSEARSALQKCLELNPYEGDAHVVLDALEERDS